MGNLLKAEFYKLLHGFSFWGITLFSFVLASILLSDSVRITSWLLNASLFNTPLLYVFIIIFAALFVGEDFSNRTLYSFVSDGHQRSSILFAKTFSYSIGAIVILILPLAVHGIIGATVPNRNGISLHSFGITLVIILLAVIAMGMLPLFFAFVLRDIGKTLAFSMAIYFLMIFALNGKDTKLFSVILPIGQLRLLSLDKLNIPGSMVLLIDVVWIFLLYVGAYISFRRSDLK